MHTRLIRLCTTSRRLQATNIVQTLHANNHLSPSSQYPHGAGPSSYLSAPPLTSTSFAIVCNVQMSDINTQLEFSKL